jgi:hypothetical protein
LGAPSTSRGSHELGRATATVLPGRADGLIAVAIETIAGFLDHTAIEELGSTSVEVCKSLGWYTCYVGAASPTTPPIALGDQLTGPL